MDKRVSTNDLILYASRDASDLERQYFLNFVAIVAIWVVIVAGFSTLLNFFASFLNTMGLWLGYLSMNVNAYVNLLSLMILLLVLWRFYQYRDVINRLVLGIKASNPVVSAEVKRLNDRLGGPATFNRRDWKNNKKKTGIDAIGFVDKSFHEKQANKPKLIEQDVRDEVALSDEVKDKKENEKS